MVWVLNIVSEMLDNPVDVGLGASLRLVFSPQDQATRNQRSSEGPQESSPPSFSRWSEGSSGTRGLSSGTRGLSAGSPPSSSSSAGSSSAGSPLDTTYELIEESKPDEDWCSQSGLWTGRIFDLANIRGERTVIRGEPTA